MLQMKLMMKAMKSVWKKLSSEQNQSKSAGAVVFCCPGLNPSVLKVSRIIADLAGPADLTREDLEDSVQYRSYGDSSLFSNEG